MGVDIYRPELWHDFFLMIGGGAAALAGLVFVAMSLNIEAIAMDATHRDRAIGTLAGFASAFVVSGFVLIADQGHVAVGFEWLVTATLAAFVYVYGYVQAIRTGTSDLGLHPGRLIFGTAVYLAQIVGAALIVSGRAAGLYIAAAAMVVLQAFMISGAWLLLVGVQQERAGISGG